VRTLALTLLLAAGCATIGGPHPSSDQPNQGLSDENRQTRMQFIPGPDGTPTAACPSGQGEVPCWCNAPGYEAMCQQAKARAWADSHQTADGYGPQDACHLAKASAQADWDRVQSGAAPTDVAAAESGGRVRCENGEALCPTSVDVTCWCSSLNPAWCQNAKKALAWVDSHPKDVGETQRKVLSLNLCADLRGVEVHQGNLADLRHDLKATGFVSLEALNREETYLVLWSKAAKADRAALKAIHSQPLPCSKFQDAQIVQAAMDLQNTLGEKYGPSSPGALSQQRYR